MAQPQHWVKVPGPKAYFWNLATSETSWEEPPGVEWVVQRTAAGGVYYWNRKTDATTWTSPFPQQQEEQGAATDGEQPLSSWPFMGGQPIAAHATAVGGKVEASPMMVVHSLRPAAPNGGLVAFADGRLMLKLPAATGSATLVVSSGAAARLKEASKAKKTVEAADHVAGRWIAKTDGEESAPALAKSGLWQLNALQELSCRYTDGTGVQPAAPLTMRQLQVKAIEALDGSSSKIKPFSCAAEEYQYFEQSSVDAAAARVRMMQRKGIIAPSVRMAARLLSSSWSPGVLSSDWRAYMAPKTLQGFLERSGRKPLQLSLGASAKQAGGAWWQAEEGAGRGAADRGPPADPGKAKSDALSAAQLLSTLNNTVLEILGSDAVEDETTLLHANANPVRSFSIVDSLAGLLPLDLLLPPPIPEQQHDLAVGFEPPPPSVEAALVKAGEKKGEQTETGCRATATRIRSSASSFYTLMGSTAADYSTMALNIQQGGRGPGLSASPFAAALAT